MSKHYVTAGFSNDPEICNMYNENLLKVWDFLLENKVVDGPAPQVELMHDVALIVKAFIDHKTKTQKIKPEKHKTPSKRVYLTKIINTIKDIINTKDKSEWTSKIVETIMYEFRHVAVNLENVECHKKNDGKLQRFTERAVEKYLTGNCRRSSNFNTMVPPQSADNIYRKGKNVCSQETLNTFIKIIKAVIQRYIVGSYCYLDKTMRENDN